MKKKRILNETSNKVTNTQEPHKFTQKQKIISIIFCIISVIIYIGVLSYYWLIPALSGYDIYIAPITFFILTTICLALFLCIAIMSPFKVKKNDEPFTMRDMRGTILAIIFGIFFVITMNGITAGKSELYRTYIQGVGNNTREELVSTAFRLGLFFSYEGPVVPKDFKPLKTISKKERQKAINNELDKLENFDKTLNKILENTSGEGSYNPKGETLTNNKSDNNVKPVLTGIEKAIKDGMLEQDIITNGITEERLRFTFSDGNLQMYYSNWEDYLQDAKTLKILK